MNYIKRLKMQRAAFTLIHSKKTVTDIAFDAGYESIEAFIRAFQKFYTCSPLQYRKRAQDNMALPQMIKTNKTMKVYMKVEIRKMPEMRIAYVRHIGPYKECSKAWGFINNLG